MQNLAIMAMFNSEAYLSEVVEDLIFSKVLEDASLLLVLMLLLNL